MGTTENEGVQNLQGVLLQQVLEQCDLSAVSQGALASGPRYTFCSREVQTTVDYILMDVVATSMLASCHTHQMEDLNTSDYLPITASLVCDASQRKDSSQTCKRIDWAEAERSGALDLFTSDVQERFKA